MVSITREIDQVILIGSAIRLSPTDIDRKGVRLLAEGRYVGGPRDGETFRSTHEVGKDGSVTLGPLITVTVIQLHADAVRLGVLAPPNLPVVRMETGR
jgi:sRNA-binding carbon storage regulator CsrA